MDKLSDGMVKELEIERWLALILIRSLKWHRHQPSMKVILGEDFSSIVESNLSKWSLGYCWYFWGHFESPCAQQIR